MPNWRMVRGRYLAASVNNSSQELLYLMKTPFGASRIFRGVPSFFPVISIHNVLGNGILDYLFSKTKLILLFSSAF